MGRKLYSAIAGAWSIIHAGYVIHWAELDEHLSSQGLLAGAPAPGAAAMSHAG